MFICSLKNLDMGIRKMEPVNLKDIIIDSLKYSASDLKMLVLLGFVLLLADTAEGLTNTRLFANEIKLVLWSIVIIMAIFEAGYVFRILIETIQGFKTLPKFNNLKLMFFQGVIELILLIIYFSIPLVFFGVFYLNFIISMDFNTLPVVTDIYILIILSLTVLIYIFSRRFYYTGRIMMVASDRALILKRYIIRLEMLVSKDW